MLISVLFLVFIYWHAFCYSYYSNIALIFKF
nr:MAG TPA: hypothetical protein [Caudoviricetes sp.]